MLRGSGLMALNIEDASVDCHDRSRIPPSDREKMEVSKLGMLVHGAGHENATFLWKVELAEAHSDHFNKTSF